MYLSYAAIINITILVNFIINIITRILHSMHDFVRFLVFPTDSHGSIASKRDGTKLWSNIINRFALHS